MTGLTLRSALPLVTSQPIRTSPPSIRHLKGATAAQRPRDRARVATRATSAREASSSHPRRHVALAPLALGVGLALTSRGEAAEAGAEALGFDEASLYEFTNEEFQRRVLQEGQTCVVMFYAPWCPYCKKMAPKWGEMASQLQRRGTGVVAARYNTDPTDGYVPYTDPEGNPVALRISAYPTLALFKGGKVARVNVGSQGGYLGPFGTSRLVDFATS